MIDTDSLLALFRSRPDLLKQLGYRIRFDLPDKALSILVDGIAEKVDLADADTPADAVIAMSSDNLKRLVDGELSPMIAFSTGRLKLSGSYGVALKLASLLGE